MHLMMNSRRASTSLMFALFAAALTYGVMTFLNQAQHAMVASLTHQVTLKY